MVRRRMVSRKVGAMGTVTELAGLLYDAFETARRATGDTATGPREDGDEYVRLVDGSPEWMTDVIRTAHGEMLPDDWRYECIMAAAECIASGGDDGEFADGQVDVYTGRRLAWLASSLDRVAYVDEAVEKFGADLAEGIVGMIALGQYREAVEVYGLVEAALADWARVLDDLGRTGAEVSS